MTITANFENYDEMVAFARNVLGDASLPVTEPAGKIEVKEEKKPAKKAEPAAPAVPAQPIAPAPTPTQQPATQPAAPAQQVQTSTVSYTPDDLARAAMTLMDKGMQTQLQQLLTQFSVQSLPELQPDQYGAFATALRGLGAQI